MERIGDGCQHVIPALRIQAASTDDLQPCGQSDVLHFVLNQVGMKKAPNWGLFLGDYLLIKTTGGVFWYFAFDP